MPKPLTSGSRADGRFDKRDFVYDAERAEYRCPAGERAVWRFRTVEHNLTLHKYWSSACPKCPLKAWMESTYFLNKTLPRVQTEMSLHVLAYNMKPIMRIFGIKPLMQAMQSYGACARRPQTTSQPSAHRAAQPLTKVVSTRSRP